MVRFTDWRPGLRKLRFILLVHASGLSLDEAKFSTEQLMLGQPFTVACSSSIAADQLAHAADQLGAVGSSQDTRADLSLDEAVFLQRAGVDFAVFTPAQHRGDSPLLQTVDEYAELVATSPSIPETAKRLGVDPSRLRHRLLAHTIFGIKDAGVWRLPLFQFDDDAKRLVPDLARVVPL